MKYITIINNHNGTYAVIETTTLAEVVSVERPILHGLTLSAGEVAELLS